jgi:hypothetical protein
MNKTWLEELHKLRAAYETRLEEVSRNNYRKEVPESEFQKRYLQEIEELQNSFHAFKLKTYDEFRALKKQKEEIHFKMTYFKDKYEALLVEYTKLEGLRRADHEIINTFGNTNDVILY